ncbi:MAG: phosphotransferase [Gammaproteobacteria bacterium]
MHHYPENPLKYWHSWETPFTDLPKIIRKLSFGRTNQSYLIEVDSQLSVLRINARNSTELGIDRHRELKILEHASSTGLSPKLHYGSVKHGVLITEFIDGQYWQPKLLTDSDKLSLLMDSLNCIHSLKVSTSPFDYKQHMENYWQVLLKRNINITDTLYQKREKLLPQLTGVPRENVLCHHDPNPMNIIVTSDKIYFIDWEYAAMAWQAFDFAAFSIEWDISMDRLSVPTNISTEEIELAKELYVYLCELWICLQYNSDASNKYI